MGTGWFGYGLVWVLVGLGTGWFGYGLVWVRVGLGTGWFGYGLVWVRVGLVRVGLVQVGFVRVGLGTGWFGYGLVWVRVGLGTGWFGYWLVWVRVNPVVPSWLNERIQGYLVYQGHCLYTVRCRFVDPPILTQSGDLCQLYDITQSRESMAQDFPRSIRNMQNFPKIAELGTILLKGYCAI